MIYNFLILGVIKLWDRGRKMGGLISGDNVSFIRFVKNNVSRLKWFVSIRRSVTTPCCTNMEVIYSTKVPRNTRLQK